MAGWPATLTACVALCALLAGAHGASESLVADPTAAQASQAQWGAASAKLGEAVGRVLAQEEFDTLVYLEVDPDQFGRDKPQQIDDDDEPLGWWETRDCECSDAKLTEVNDEYVVCQDDAHRGWYKSTRDDDDPTVDVFEKICDTWSDWKKCVDRATKSCWACRDAEGVALGTLVHEMTREAEEDQIDAGFANAWCAGAPAGTLPTGLAALVAVVIALAVAAVAHHL